ncbi:hypothetical protein B0I03_101523 [Flavobacterium aquaticum]|uniref:Uncharacterized protein n=1 Tax=Flavobacterium aquaticum TaxID=1236486 RepID=A0A327Z4N5_9FLAO|nr:hypothetical protein B0I03_101523 [Flavobacterium aquaticum]
MCLKKSIKPHRNIENYFGVRHSIIFRHSYEISEKYNVRSSGLTILNIKDMFLCGQKNN